MYFIKKKLLGKCILLVINSYLLLLIMILLSLNYFTVIIALTVYRAISIPILYLPVIVILLYILLK